MKGRLEMSLVSKHGFSGKHNKAFNLTWSGYLFRSKYMFTFGLLIAGQTRQREPVAIAWQEPQWLNEQHLARVIGACSRGCKTGKRFAYAPMGWSAPPHGVGRYKLAFRRYLVGMAG